MRFSAHIRDALAATVLGGTLVVAGACSDTTTAEDYSGSGAEADAGGDEAQGSSGGVEDSGPGQTGDPFGSTGGDDDPRSDTGEYGTTGGETGGEESPPDIGPYDLCPDVLPDGWIFCEDFETPGDPAGVFFDYADSEGNFVPSFEGGASGIGAMKAHYREGLEPAGFISVSFGENPINNSGRPTHGGDGQFDEIYWRFRVKMQSGWPDAGPHNLTRISAFAQSDWGQAMVASIGSKGDDVTLQASAASCVQDGQVMCTGIDDAESFEPLGVLTGETPVFSKERSGRWQCVEAHVRLNTPGEVDGVFELWVDGQLEAAQDAVNWRGSWADFGLNLLSIENLWVGGAPADLDRWFDDLVISTQPIGCE